MKEFCPFCKSKNIRHDKKQKYYRCADCGEGFDTPYIPQNMKLFLSYGHDQKYIAEKIKLFLEDNGYEVWLDSSRIKVGNDWREKITSGLYESERVISLVSKHAIREKGVCLDELRIAIFLKRAYVYVVLTEKLTDDEIPALISHNQRLDISDLAEHPSDWDQQFQKYMTELLHALSSNEVQTYHTQMRSLSNKMQIIDNNVKETLLTKSTFVGRQWLFDEIRSWLMDSSEKVLVVYGVPGAGKSAFSANLPSIFPEVFASVFLKWNSYTAKDADSFTRLLAYKLAATLPGYRESLYNAYKYGLVHEGITGQDLFDTIVLNPLNHYIEGKHETGFIIIDGLDEASPDVIELIRNNLDSFPDIIKILITSRNDLNISSCLNDYQHVVIENSGENHLHDIKQYLSQSLKLPENNHIITEIANKAEGSFMYAVAFCDSINSGRMSLEDISCLPSGLNNFYRSFFHRIFQDVDFESLRPLLEILCIDADIPETILAECLKITDHRLIDLRLKLKSLIVSTETHFDPFNISFENIFPNYLPILRLAHQSIKEWLTDKRLAAEYYIDPSNGYRTLAEYYENYPKHPREESNELKYFNFLINIGKKDEDPNCDENPYLPFLAETMIKFQKERYIKWLILGGEYDKAENILLGSFKRDLAFDAAYSELIPLWQWADLFPRTRSVSKLVNKLEDLARLTIGHLKSTPSDTPLLWRDMIYCFIILGKIMDSGRFAPAFFETVRQFPLALLVKRGNDGYDEGTPTHAIAYHITVCRQKLHMKGISIPDDVSEKCDILISLSEKEEKREG